MRAVFGVSLGLIALAVLGGCTAAGTLRENAPLSGALGATDVETHKGAGVLYVDDAGKQTVDIFKNGSWKKLGGITGGIGDIDLNWVDSKGNFYFAQFSPGDIVEYPLGASAPSFTYDSKMEFPVDVATDRAGNVYEVDEQTSSVNEYAQHSNTISVSCGNGGALFLSEAIDSSGDVFVGVEIGARGRIVEYVGGLNGCHATQLGVALNFPGGMALDKKGDIVICDQGNNSVDIIPPPYSSVSGTLGSGYSMPVSVRLNRRNDEAYVVNEGPPNAVFVLRYPTGSLIKKLSSKNGISGAAGAVDSDNFSR
jgi:DNA-binding beta-propeller fold protein YncE